MNVLMPQHEIEELLDHVENGNHLILVEENAAKNEIIRRIMETHEKRCVSQLRKRPVETSPIQAEASLPRV